MPKHTKKARNAKNTHTASRPFFTKTEGQEYALVTKMLGDCRVECRCFDGVTRLGVIRNKLRKGKNNKIKVEDIVIASKRDFQDNKVDIIHVYNPEEVNRLQRMKEIPTLKKEEGDLMTTFDLEEKEDEPEFVFARPDDDLDVDGI